MKYKFLLLSKVKLRTIQIITNVFSYFSNKRLIHKTSFPSPFPFFTVFGDELWKIDYFAFVERLAGLVEKRACLCGVLSALKIEAMLRTLLLESLESPVDFLQLESYLPKLPNTGVIFRSMSYPIAYHMPTRLNFK
ncbi:MAG: hypothetical protein IPJ69_00030 [Deltaproteobacteria bacterium]|nr:MAG: hypothetical protein IPJ69_00030 [Deltaproteobacteria bacterium]